MKQLISILLVLSITNVTGQNLKDRTVFTKYILGVDSVKSVIAKSDEPKYQKHYLWLPDGYDLFSISYQLPSHASVNILVVNDTLYGVRFSPYDCRLDFENVFKSLQSGEITKLEYDKKISNLNYKSKGNEKFFESYIRYLNSRFTIVYHRQLWENDFISISYDGEYFDHFDKELLNKYPQFKNF